MGKAGRVLKQVLEAYGISQNKLAVTMGINEQIVALLQRALDTEAQRQSQAKVLQDIHQARWTPPAIAPDSVTLLREIRGYDE
ncbi:MAG: XRE family transcriptional regulator [Nodosilinea sp.]|jgi:hypothetical protein